ncbi:uncharacterized protein LOC110615404 [Manihot esculenta]|uniref:uncharacterized protein LOC110615404 n=1 Tax=Manihot esculenta TaxID=3983 RepID=UPI000B5D13B9|nr:uncharacterized protein LOC110615404 [Manihot esculenta]
MRALSFLPLLAVDKYTFYGQRSRSEQRADTPIDQKVVCYSRAIQNSRKTSFIAPRGREEVSVDTLRTRTEKEQKEDFSLDDASPRFASSFSEEILAETFPAKFKLPSFDKYDGTTYSISHLVIFKMTMQFQDVNDFVLCQGAIAINFDHMAKVPYASAVGTSMYVMVYTRLDIAHAVGAVSKYMSNPGKEYWDAMKWLLRYLKGITSTSFCYGNGKVLLKGFVDTDLSGDVDTSKSTSEYVYNIDGTTVSWTSKFQKCLYVIYRS